MSIKRFTGLVFIIGLLLLTLFVFLKPQINYQYGREVKLDEDNKEIVPTKDIDVVFDTKNKNLEAMSIKKSDFDMFVLRVHVLSSKDSATLMVTKLQDNGILTFAEVFGEEKNLYAVYVGPFHEENDMHNNIEHIQKISETTKGEIFRWKP